MCVCVCVCGRVQPVSVSVCVKGETKRQGAWPRALVRLLPCGGQIAWANKGLKVSGCPHPHGLTALYGWRMRWAMGRGGWGGVWQCWDVMGDTS